MSESKKVEHVIGIVKTMAFHELEELVKEFISMFWQDFITLDALRDSVDPDKKMHYLQRTNAFLPEAERHFHEQQAKEEDDE